MEMKDDIIARLNEELVKRETQLKFEVEKMKKVGCKGNFSRLLLFNKGPGVFYETEV
jgi:hypothetical protein